MQKRILLIEDEPHIVAALSFLLQREGLKVSSHDNGADALDRIRDVSPDLIILDIMLPGIDGCELCEIVKLSPEWKNIKIIFLTAKGRDVDVAKGMVLGADEYIAKPFPNKQVVESVQKLLEEKISGCHEG